MTSDVGKLNYWLFMFQRGSGLCQRLYYFPSLWFDSPQLLTSEPRLESVPFGQTSLKEVGRDSSFSSAFLSIFGPYDSFALSFNRSSLPKPWTPASKLLTKTSKLFGFDFFQARSISKVQKEQKITCKHIAGICLLTSMSSRSYSSRYFETKKANRIQLMPTCAMSSSWSSTNPG